MLPKILNKIEKNELSTNEFISFSAIFGINVFLLQIYLSNLTQNQNIKWMTHLFVMTLVTILIIIKNIFFKLLKLNNYHYLVNLIIFLILFQFYLDDSITMDLLYKIKLAIVITVVLAIYIYMYLNIEIKYISINILAVLISVFSFLNLPNGLIFENIFNINYKKIILVIIIIFMAKKIYELYAKIPDTNLKLFSYILIFVSTILAFRNDQIYIRDGSFFHVSYFSEVIRTLKSGGTLLWDTPSQYGFLSVLIPSFLPIEDSRQSFFIWQAFIIVIYNLSTYIFLKFILKSYKITNLMFLLFIIFFHFADPALIGPQPFPSSSIMRFGPSMVTLLIIIYFYYKKLNLNKINIILYILILNISYLWSSESLIYSFVISCTSSLIMLIEKRLNNVLTKIYVFAPILSIFSALVLLNLYTLTLKSHFADISMYFMYSTTYSKGYGSLPLTVESPAIIIYLLIFLVTFEIFKREKNNINEKIIYTSLVSILIYLTYYLGRAVSNNIMVLMPIFFIIFLIIYLNLKNLYIKNILKINFIIINIMFLTSIFLQPKLLNKVESFSFGINSLDPKTVYQYDMNLKTYLKNSDKSEIVLSSWAAGIPLEISQDLRFSRAFTPIPVPLQLLEEPINIIKAKQIFNRYTKSNQIKNIKFIQIKDNLSQERLSYWLEIIENNFNCDLRGETDYYEVFECTKAQTSK